MDWVVQSWDVALAIFTWGAGVMLGLAMLSGLVIAVFLALLAAVGVAGAVYVLARLAVEHLQKWRRKEAEGGDQS